MTFDIAKYAVQNETEDETPSYQPNENFDPNKFAVNPDPSQQSELLRHAARTISRGAETVLGFLGDLNQLVQTGEEKLGEAVGGEKPELNLALKAFHGLMGQLPTSESLKKKSIEATSGYTAPQTEKEEIGDEIASLTTALAIPARLPATFGQVLKGIGKAVGMATGTKAVGETAKVLGATPEQQAYTEIGTLFLTSLFSGKTAGKYVNELYQDARSKIPSGTMVQTGQLESDLKVLSTDLSKGISTSSKSEVKKAVDELASKAASGTMEADELIQSFHDINERISSKKLWEELSKSEQRQLRHRYDLMKDKVRESIKDYGQYNPEFYNSWQKANEGYATIQNSLRFSRTLEGWIGNLPKHLALGLGAELMLGYPKVAIATAGAAGAVKYGELMYRVVKSPALREHYQKAIQAVLSEDKVAFTNQLFKLNEGLKQD